MLKRSFLTLMFALFLAMPAFAQSPKPNPDNVMILPFENTSGRPEFNWVGESFADSLSDLLKVPGINVVSNEERKIIQQRLRVPLTTLPSLATSLKLAREGKASLLISGNYNISPAQGETAAGIKVKVKLIRVNEGRFLSEELPNGQRISRDIDLTDALANLQTVQGQLAFQIIYQRDKNSLPFSENEFKRVANKVPARAFEAYVKGLLTAETDPQTKENYFKNALRLYGEAKNNEVYPEAALELGHLFLNQKQYQNSVDFFSKVPQNDSHYAEAAFYTGLIYWSTGNFEPALAVLSPLAEDLKLTSVYNTLGAIAIQAAREEKTNKPKSEELLKRGLEFLQKALESEPENQMIMFNYSLALFLDNKVPETITQLRPVLAIDQRDGEAYYLLAKSLSKLDDPTATEFDNQARKFLTADNKYAKLEEDWKRTRLVEQIKMRVRQPQRQEFVAVVLSSRQKAGLSQVPVDENEALLEQARAYYKGGRDDDALATILRILSSEPMTAEAHLIKGNILLRRGEIDNARDSLKTALFWDNRLIDAHIILGRIFLEKKDCLQAENYSKSALQLDESNQEAIGLQRQVERCSK